MRGKEEADEHLISVQETGTGAVLGISSFLWKSGVITCYQAETDLISLCLWAREAGFFMLVVSFEGNWQKAETLYK